MLTMHLDHQGGRMIDGSEDGGAGKWDEKAPANAFLLLP